MPNTRSVYINIPHEKLTSLEGIEYIINGNRNCVDMRQLKYIYIYIKWKRITYLREIWGSHGAGCGDTAFWDVAHVVS
jgi:hypothetical protein